MPRGLCNTPAALQHTLGLAVEKSDPAQAKTIMTWQPPRIRKIRKLVEIG